MRRASWAFVVGMCGKQATELQRITCDVDDDD